MFTPATLRPFSHALITAASLALCLGCQIRSADDAPTIDLDPMSDAGPLLDLGPRTDATAPMPDAFIPRVDAETPMPDAALADADVPDAQGPDAEPPPDPPVGSAAIECGAPDPVDCTAGGDADAQCIFSDHCACSEGFLCEDGTEGECAPGVICEPDWAIGSSPDGCGSPTQDLMPVDCTARGDAAAQCVFSNHCWCSEGFLCEDGTEGECDPGVICVPDWAVGSSPSGCGAPDQGLEPIDCTAEGDVDAICVFSNHCLCSDGFVCEGTAEGGECEPGTGCAPAP